MLNISNKTPVNNKEWLNLATELVSHGWSILPIGKNKKPLVKWKEYQSRKPTTTELSNWSQLPSLNGFALVTGSISGVFVLDIDQGSKFDTSALPETLFSKTGSGGFHYFFQYPENIEIGNYTAFEEHTDIRGEGGYAVLPPAMHPSGNRYSWQSDSFTITPAPQFLIDKLQKNTQLSLRVEDNDITQGKSIGSRNNSAAKLIGKLLSAHDEDDWQTVAWPLVESWNQTNKPPLPLIELRQTFQSIASREKQQRGGTETPQGIQKRDLLEENIVFSQLVEDVEAFLPGSSKALKLVLSVAISSHFGSTVMLWLLLVGVPSSGKTDVVRLIKDAPSAFYLDNLTQNAFISSERPTAKQKVYDLLPLLDKKCLIIKDWTAIFSLDEKMTKKLLGDLVGIYDKEFAKFSSRRGNITYSSAFSQLGCITPATLNKHTQYMNMVGPRFLCYTIPNIDLEMETDIFAKIFSGVSRSKQEDELRLKVSTYLEQLKQETFEIKPFSDPVKAFLQKAAKLIACCRGVVVIQSQKMINDEGNSITYYEIQDIQIEQPWRSVQQISSLAKYLTFIARKKEVGFAELEIIKDVVLSSMPANRAEALKSIIKSNGEVTAKVLSDGIDKSVKTSRRLLDELAALKVLNKIKNTANLANDYLIDPYFRDFILLDPAEFMSRSKDFNRKTIEDMSQEEIFNVLDPQEGAV